MFMLLGILRTLTTIDITLRFFINNEVLLLLGLIIRIIEIFKFLETFARPQGLFETIGQTMNKRDFNRCYLTSDRMF